MVTLMSQFVQLYRSGNHALETLLQSKAAEVLEMVVVLYILLSKKERGSLVVHPA